MERPKMTPKLWRLFEQRWRDKCANPCVGNRHLCSCWQWAVTRHNIAKQFAK